MNHLLSTLFKLINSLYCDTINIDVNSSIYPIIIIPNKNLAFHIITIPKNNTLHANLCKDLSNNFTLQNIRLIHIWEDFWNLKHDIIESRIKLLLGKFIRIHARQTFIKKIDKPTCDSFLITNHLYGSTQAKYKYGVYFNKCLVATASFSAIRTYWRIGIPYKSSELIRYCSLNGYSVVGGLSKLIANFIKEYQPDDIMSYADRDWSNGNAYEKIGFQKLEDTPPQSFWIHPKELIRYYPHKLPEKLLYEFQHQNNFMILDDFLIFKGYIQIFNSGNIKYLLKLK